jgi:hypothetical protein
MPKDHSCLFHAVCYGLRLKYDGHLLRKNLYHFLLNNSNMLLLWPLNRTSSKSDYLSTEYGQTVNGYGENLRQNHFWGGATELTIMKSQLKCNFYVYIVTNMNSTGPFSDSKYTRVASYEFVPEATSVQNVHLLHENGSHYVVLKDVSVMTSSTITPITVLQDKDHKKEKKRAYDLLSVRQ